MDYFSKPWTQPSEVDIFMQTMTCTRCKTTAPRTAFKRLASLAQTRSWLKKPEANKRAWYFGTICNACHKLTKRKPSELTPEEHRKHLIKEGNDAEYAWYIYNQRREAGKKKLSAIGTKAIAKHRKPLFSPMRDALNKFVATLKSKQNYITKTNKREEDVKALEYLNACLAQTTYARNQLNAKMKAGSTPPARWVNLVLDTTEITTQYNALSGEYKDRFAKIHKQFL